MSNREALISQLIAAVQQPLSYGDPADKARFHALAKKVLAQVANDLGYVKSEYDIRSNPGGIAVGGEVTLHAADLYVQFGTSEVLGCHILYRSCAGRKDYTGGPNQWAKYDDLLSDYEALLRNFTKLRARQHKWPRPTACGRDDCCMSTGICECPTFGRGKLDRHGYWAEPCGPCARRHEQEHPEDGPCWPAEAAEGV